MMMMAAVPVAMNMFSNPASQELEACFGSRLHRNVSLARFSTARLGGKADALLKAHTAEDLAEIVIKLWSLKSTFIVLGMGSNVLISDDGVKEVVVLNQAKGIGQIQFEMKNELPSVWAASGVTFSMIARQAAKRALSGLEWAVGIPGTVGGAVVGNAGALGSDMAGNLIVADILHQVPQTQRIERGMWEPARFGFAYRESLLKGKRGEIVVLGAKLRLEHSSSDKIFTMMEENLGRRRNSQPPGASLGSIFKNPPGDYAGRLIEAAGLKGLRVGSAEISPIHANFFIVHPHGKAADVWSLINIAQNTVAERFGVALQMEIELVGEWPVGSRSAEENYG
jgi:UDP-N-acetylmuramate dehydrogenase